MHSEVADTQWAGARSVRIPTGGSIQPPPNQLCRGAIDEIADAMGSNNAELAELIVMLRTYVDELSGNAPENVVEKLDCGPGRVGRLRHIERTASALNQELRNQLTRLRES